MTFFSADSDQRDNIGVMSDGLHDLHLLQEVRLFLLWRVLLRRLDGDDNRAVVAADVLGFRLPDL